MIYLIQTELSRAKTCILLKLTWQHKSNINTQVLVPESKQSFGKTVREQRLRRIIMGTERESQHPLPVIDFSDENLKPGTGTWVSACDVVRGALEDHGGFLALYN